MSDGCLTKNKKRNIIVIGLNDLEMIEKIHKYVECKRSIYNQNKQYSVYYWNEEAVEYLKEYGLESRKSMTLKFPFNIPVEYYPDFIRGYFDGDGSVVFNETEYNIYPQVSFTTGSKEFAYGLKDALKILGIDSKVYITDRTGNYNYTLKIIKINEVKKFKDMIYHKENIIKLERKCDKFKKLDLINKKYKTAD